MVSRRIWGYRAANRLIYTGYLSFCSCSSFIHLVLSPVDCAVTVCDTEGVILYMNEKARATFAQHGDLIGRNLFDCHNERSRETIRRMLASGGTNAYTIEKQGVRKMIYQTAWRERGEIRGLVEISMELPDEMPHYIRK